MDENKLHEKLDKIISDVNDVKIVQVQQQATLDHHVYRCDLLEESNKTLKDEAASAFQEIRNDLEPLKSFHNRWIGAAKWTSLVLAVATVIIGAIKLIVR